MCKALKVPYHPIIPSWGTSFPNVNYKPYAFFQTLIVKMGLQTLEEWLCAIIESLNNSAFWIFEWKMCLKTIEMKYMCMHMHKDALIMDQWC